MKDKWAKFPFSVPIVKEIDIFLFCVGSLLVFEKKPIIIIINCSQIQNNNSQTYHNLISINIYLMSLIYKFVFHFKVLFKSLLIWFDHLCFQNSVFLFYHLWLILSHQRSAVFFWIFKTETYEFYSSHLCANVRHRLCINWKNSGFFRFDFLMWEQPWKNIINFDSDIWFLG